MSQEKGIIKKSEMNSHTNYLLCPDPSCKLFYDTSQYTPCEDKCPQQKELIKIIQCNSCKEPIELPGDHFLFRRVDHNCPNGNLASNFQRMKPNYQLIYERPK